MAAKRLWYNSGMDLGQNSWGSLGGMTPGGVPVGGVGGNGMGTFGSGANMQAPQPQMVGGGKKKSRKIFFIFLGVLIACGVVIIGVFTLLPANDSVDLKMAFGKYVGYLLSGDENDVNAIEQVYIPDYVYFFKSQSYIDDDAKRQEYFSDLLNKYSAFVNMVDSANLGSEKKKIIDSYSEQIYAYTDYASNRKITEDALLSYLSANGYSRTREDSIAYYNNLSSSTDETASTLGEYLTREVIYWVDRDSFLKDSGCVNNDVIDSDCAVAALQNKVFDEDIMSVQNGVRLKTKELENKVKSRCWEIYALL